MGSTLTNTQPKDTYKSLLKTSDSTELSATAKYVSDGNGNDSPLAVSTSAVGIGTSSPSNFGKLGITASNSATKSAIGIGVNQNGSNASPYTNALIEAMTLGGTAESGIYSINTFFDNSRNDIAIRTSATSGAIAERVRFTENGITFNGDTAAANALDDYEEGTFTVTASPISSGSITLSTATGSYTKIGNQVSITAFLIVGSVSLPVGAYITMGGLPFAVPNSDRYAGAPSVTYFDAPVYTSQVRPSYIVKNTSGFNVAIDASTVGALDEFYFSLTYFV